MTDRFERGPPEVACTWCLKPAAERALVDGELVCRACCEAAADWAEPRAATWQAVPTALTKHAG